MGNFSLRNLFRRKRSLANISIDELQREKAHLDLEANRLNEELTRLESRKKKLFLQGKDEASQQQRIHLAHQIKTVDSEYRSKQREHALISRQLATINRFVQIKKSKRLEQMGLGRIIDQLDLEQLDQYMVDASIDGQVQWDQLGEILSRVEQTERLTGELDESLDVADILQAFDEAKAAELDNPAEAERIAMERLDRALHSKEPEPFEEEDF